MTELETRYPCPVCLGVKLDKITVSTRPRLWLDHCGRCGGVWFEAGEVQQLKKVEPRQLWSRITQREGIHRMQCHRCEAHVARNEKECSSCGWKIRLDCPVCTRPMKTSEHLGLHLDACKQCQGVWFDHNELAAIWSLQITAAKKRTSAGDGSLVLLDALAYDPFLMYYGVHAAGHVVGASAEVLSHAPGAMAGAFEVAGEVAGSVFEAIAEIIGGLFN